MEEKILEIFKKNRIYSDSDIFEKTEEFDFVDENEKDFYVDIDFIIENIDNYFSDYVQIVKKELLIDIWKEAQKEVFDKLLEEKNNLNIPEYFKNDFEKQKELYLALKILGKNYSVSPNQIIFTLNKFKAKYNRKDLQKELK